MCCKRGNSNEQSDRHLPVQETDRYQPGADRFRPAQRRVHPEILQEQAGGGYQSGKNFQMHQHSEIDLAQARKAVRSRDERRLRHADLRHRAERLLRLDQERLQGDPEAFLQVAERMGGRLASRDEVDSKDLERAAKQDPDSAQGSADARGEDGDNQGDEESSRQGPDRSVLRIGEEASARYSACR